MNFQFVELYLFELSIPGISVMCSVHIKGCVKIFIYCLVHKVYSNNCIKFILHHLSFMPIFRLKLTATTRVYQVSNKCLIFLFSWSDINYITLLPIVNYWHNQFHNYLQFFRNARSVSSQLKTRRVSINNYYNHNSGCKGEGGQIKYKHMQIGEESQVSANFHVNTCSI